MLLLQVVLEAEAKHCRQKRTSEMLQCRAQDTLRAEHSAAKEGGVREERDTQGHRAGTCEGCSLWPVPQGCLLWLPLSGSPGLASGGREQRGDSRYPKGSANVPLEDEAAQQEDRRQQAVQASPAVPAPPQPTAARSPSWDNGRERLRACGHEAPCALGTSLAAGLQGNSGTVKKQRP